MSLDTNRDAYIREKKNEIRSVQYSHRRKLRELYAYTTAWVSKAAPKHAHFHARLDVDPSVDELKFLNQNDLENDRSFHDDSLPDPSQNAYTASKSLPSPFSGLLSRLSKSPSPSRQTISGRGASHPPAEEKRSDIHMPDANGSDSPKPGYDQFSRGNATVDPQDVMPVSTDDIDTVPTDGVALQTKSTDTPSGALPVPPKDSHRHLQANDHAQDRITRSDRKETEKLGVTPYAHHVGGEAASSPSSTIGPYSTTTPRPTQQSPDTSPDNESFRDDVPIIPSTHKGPSSEADFANDEKDEILKAQMRIAREDTHIGGPVTEADAQLQMEEEQATRVSRDGVRLPGTMSGEDSGAQAILGHVSNSTLTEGASGIVEESLGQQEDGDPAAAAALSISSEKGPRGTANDETVTISDREKHDSKTTSESSEKLASPEPTERTGPSETPSRPGLMITRVSSGAIRQKSVSEIIGEEPKSQASSKSSLPSLSESQVALHQAQRPHTSDGKHRRKPSTVVFAKKTPSRNNDAKENISPDYAALRGASEDPQRDYLLPLFDYQARQPPRTSSLTEMLGCAPKTMTTAGQYAALRELQDYRILRRIYHLQNANRWSLRQMEAAGEPSHPITHVDHLMVEMKWMRTDFRQERRWKISLAKNMALWCADWVASDSEGRVALQVRTKPSTLLPIGREGDSQSSKDQEIVPPTPGLTSSGATEDESFLEVDAFPDFVNAEPASSLFALGFDDVLLTMQDTPATDTVMKEIPKFDPGSSYDDSPCPIIPVSKLVTGKIMAKISTPPRKRSRYEYESEDEPPTPPRKRHLSDASVSRSPSRLFVRDELPPEETGLALFSSENKHVRDRLHAGQHFRPPSEFPMPPTSFFECRNSSQWLWDEDQKLRNLVKEYTFNWSLIASSLHVGSDLVSGAERRTPWECFERWINLEGLPSEWQKSQYFRTYQARLEHAQRTVSAQYQAQQAQQPQLPGSAIGTPTRRRTTQPFRVERRKNNRYLAMIDAMRKLARKRETAAHKQQEAAKAAALRKAQEAVRPKNNVHTPQEFSKLKYERDQKMAENYRNQLMAQKQNTAAMQRQALGLSNGVSQQRNAASGIPHGPSPLGTAAGQAGHAQGGANGQARPIPGQGQMPHNMPNGSMPGVSMQAPNIPQAQMQVNMQNQQRLQHQIPPDLRMAAMQRGMNMNSQYPVSQQQYNQGGNSSSPPNMGNSNGAMPNPAMLAAMSQQKVSGTGNGMLGVQSSPHMTNRAPNIPQQLSSGHTPALHSIESQIRAQHPNMSAEQVSHLATERLKGAYLQQRQTAMNAAAGPSASPAPSVQNGFSHPQQPQMSPPNGAGASSPQALYQQQLRNHMLQQRAQGTASPGMNSNAGRPPSRSATPQNPQLMQRAGSGVPTGQEQHSPRAPQAHLGAR